MTPRERFQELQKKKFCFQCLYPESNRDKGKTQEGHSQRDFACHYKSHEKYARIKQILVCQEQSDTDKNKNFLKTFNTKCILREKPTLPDFSKYINLSYHTASPINVINNETSYNLSSSNQMQDKAKFIFQTIRIIDNELTIFYEDECRNRFCKYSTVQHLGRKAQ